MAKITVEEITSKETWEKFMASHPEANFLHSFNWGEFHKALNHKIRRIGFYQNNKLMGIMLAIVENAKRGRYLTVPGGPIIDWTDKIQVNGFLQEVKRLAKEERSVFIRVRPQLKSNDFSKRLFETLGFKNAPMHLHAELTHQLTLDKSEDQILSEMRKATRYEIRQAINLGIEVKISQDPKDIEDFYKLQSETARRQGFIPFGKKFLKEQFLTFALDNQVILYSSYLGKKKLAQAFIIFYGQEADYHYGASTLDGRKYPGAYLIQWEAIKEAKKRGMERYNFWGVAPEGETNHRFWGVSVFKRGFGGEDLEYLHARDLVINPLGYKINWLVETIRKRKRHV